MAKLTREQMEAVIAKRGSVMYKGRIIRTVDGLPSKAELAAGDPEAEAKTAAELDAEIKRLEGEKAKLGKAAPAAESKADTSAEDKVLGQNVPEVADYVAGVTDPEELERLYEAESDREQPRKGVIAAIEARQAELEKQ